MKYILKKVSILLLAWVLVVSTCSLSVLNVPHATANSIDKAKLEKERLENKKKQMEEELKELEKEKKNLSSYIAKLDTKLNKLNDNIEELNGKIEKAEVKLAKTKEDLIEAEETEVLQYETMKKRIKYMYENGSSEYVETLLGSENISDFLNRTEYMAKISEYDNNMLKTYQDTKKQVQDMKQSIEEYLEELGVLQEEVTIEKDSVDKLISNKQKELEKDQKNIEATNDAVDKYAKQIREQDDLIEQLIEEELRRAEERARRAEEERRRKEEEERRRREEEAAANGNGQNDEKDDYTPPVSNTGFTWPLPSSRKVTSNFGYRSSPTQGASSYHQGVDISGSSGSQIVAAASGTVSVATYQWAAGNYVMISHADGISTVYMHCSKLLVSEGQSVKKGEVIGLVGSTGVSTGPHLHFGLRKDGTYVNPLNYIR